MSGGAAPRRTPLHDLHVAAGAKMVEFAGWSMPVSYSGVIDEHSAVRTRCGLFDVSHMGQASVRGPGALGFLQRVTCNDVSRIRPGRAQYNALTTEDGTFVDDLLIYALGATEFLLVLNAGNTAKDMAWLADHAMAFAVSVDDVSERYALLSLQGPRALSTLAPLARDPISELRYYGFVQTDVCRVPCLVSRTGYTGEDGFEVYAPPGEAKRLWQALIEAGASAGLVPVGLGARDTLRLEAKMALYGQDIDDTTTVLEADLAWIVKLDKGEFIGRDTLARQASSGVARRIVGFEMVGRPIARHGYRALVAGQPAGQVTSGTHSPTLRKSIGLAYLPIECSPHGTEFDVDVRGRPERAVVVPTPFYKRPH